MGKLPDSIARDIASPAVKMGNKSLFPAGERSELSRREAWPQWGLGRSPKRPAGRVGGEQSDRQGAMRHRTPRARGQPLRAVCPRNVVRLFRPLGRNWTTRINSGRPTVRLPQAEAWAERERVPSGHNCRRQLATGRPEQIQEPGTAVPGTPIFANNAQRGGPPLESPCRQLSLVLSFASKESTFPPRCDSPTVRAGVGASGPRQELLSAKLP